jgi:MFS transporter, Spinster family, sphingosine-1-phosphate transporter
MSFRPALRSAWLTLALLSGLNMLNYLDRYVFSAVLMPVQHDLHMGDEWGGWAASAFMLGYFVTAPFFGYLGDRYPRKYLMLAGVLVWSLATAGTALAQNFGELFAIRVVVGIGEACFVTMGPSWISDLFAGTRRNTAITLFYVAIPCGSAIGFNIGGHFAQNGDWRNAFWWVGLPGVLFALSLLLLREPPRGEADGLQGHVAPPRLTEVLQLLTRRRYLLLVGGYAAQTFSIGAFAVWGPSFLHRLHALPIDRADSLFGMILAGTGLAATLSGGFIANRLRRRTESGYVWLMAGSMIAAVPVCALALLVPGTTLTLVALGVSMFLLFLPTGPITTEMFEIVPAHLRASAVALCTFCIHLFGDLGSPALVGSISQKVHDVMTAAGSAAALADTENAIGLRYGVLTLPVVLAIGAILWSAILFFPAKERA